MEATKEPTSEVKKPRRILITGLPGSGKSKLTQYLESQGKRAIDADKVFLSYNGKPLPFGASIWWGIKNFPTWDEKKFQAVLEENKDRDLYVLGVVPGILKYLSFFDKIYYLDADKETLTKRLETPRPDNNYGTSIAQRKIAAALVPVAVIASKIAGFEFIDATMKPEEIFAKICVPPMPK